VLATRHDLRLGLHRLLLEGELTEIREPDLRFTLAEAQELFDIAGIQLTAAEFESHAEYDWEPCRTLIMHDRAGRLPELPDLRASACDRLDTTRRTERRFATAASATSGNRSLL
jgi:hypothetical protein